MSSAGKPGLASSKRSPRPVASFFGPSEPYLSARNGHEPSGSRDERRLLSGRSVSGQRNPLLRDFHERNAEGGAYAFVRSVVLRPVNVLRRRLPKRVRFVLLVVLVYVLVQATGGSDSENKWLPRASSLAQLRPTVPRQVRERLDRLLPSTATDELGHGQIEEVAHQRTMQEEQALRERNPKVADHRPESGERVADVTPDAPRTKPKPRKPKKMKGSNARAVKYAYLPTSEEARRDGRITLKKGQLHPIPALMQRARHRWIRLRDRQSKTFRQAVDEYVKRYGRAPPKHFDQWYAFAKLHDVLLIDEFDTIERDLRMFRAFRPRDLRERIKFMPTFLDKLWTIEVKAGKIRRTGELAEHDRAYGVADLTQRFAHLLPDMQMVYNGHDGARIAVTGEERQRLEELVSMGKYDEETNTPPYTEKESGPFPHWGYSVMCPPGSAVREKGFDYGWASMDSTGYEMPPLIEGSVGSVIENQTAYMDHCNAPHYRHFHCTTSWVYEHHPKPVVPLFSAGVQSAMGDIYTIIVEQLGISAPSDPEWEDRIDKLVWRGQTSGPYWSADVPWRATQRARLHLLTHQTDGQRSINMPATGEVVVPKSFSNAEVNEEYFDAGMNGPPVQCSKGDGTCDKMTEVFGGFDKRISLEDEAQHKYLLDVDGNSWSGRFRRLMLSNGAVVKATIFREFWTDWTIPWLHYIPVQVDYSDLWDVMAFFRGDPDGKGAHDEYAEKIAVAGKAWVKQCYRYVDLETFQFRLMLEYARLVTDETSPGSNDLNVDIDKEPVWQGDGTEEEFMDDEAKEASSKEAENDEDDLDDDDLDYDEDDDEFWEDDEDLGIGAADAAWKE